MSAGDITLTAAINAVVVTGFTVRSLNINLASGTMQLLFQDPGGGIHIVDLNDVSCVGFGIVGSVITDAIPRAVAAEYTKMIGILFGAATGNANARRTAATQALVTDGIITVTGTVA